MKCVNCGKELNEKDMVLHSMPDTDNDVLDYWSPGDDYISMFSYCTCPHCDTGYSIRMSYKICETAAREVGTDDDEFTLTLV